METKRIHFMGIGGAGVSAVAAFAKEAGFQVTGCDQDQSSLFLKPLLENGISVEYNHDPSHLENIDILVISPAIESLDPNNPELVAAKQKNIPVMIGEKFLAENILKGKKVIAISGTHGKSTATAMVGKILEDAGFDPSVLVGAIVSDWGKNYRLGSGEYFVLEADEYQEKLLLYHPFISVITAIEMDHPEYFRDLEQITATFQKFVDNTSETVVVGQGVELKKSIAKLVKLGKDFKIEKFDLKLIGDFNQTSALIALEVVKLLGIDEQTARASLSSFSGIGRRFEFKGEENGVKVFDDYGHHPTAVKTVAEAARQKFPNQKIWLVYQPHMYTRTKYLEEEFVETFKNIPIDEIILVKIFAARQENAEKIESSDIVTQVQKENVRYIANLSDAADYLLQNVRSGDVVINMGAGDIYKLSTELLTRLKNHD